MNKIQREALKARVAAQKATSFIQLAPDAQETPRKPAKASEAPGGDITYQCGHKGSLHHLKGQACPACRALGRKAKRPRGAPSARKERTDELDRIQLRRSI